MSKIDEAIERIRILECPTGELAERVSGILEDYGIADKRVIDVDRDDTLDRNEAKEYRIDIPDEGKSFVVLAKSGYDDYVAKVLDVHLI